MKDLKSFPVYVPVKLFIKFKKKCVTEGKSMNEVIREFIKSFVN